MKLNVFAVKLNVSIFTIEDVGPVLVPELTQERNRGT